MFIQKQMYTFLKKKPFDTCMPLIHMHYKNMFFDIISVLTCRLKEGLFKRKYFENEANEMK